MFAYILLSICENHGTQVKDVYLDADLANDEYAKAIAANNEKLVRYQLLTRTVKEPEAVPKAGLRCHHSAEDFRNGVCSRCGSTNPNGHYMAPIPLTKVADAPQTVTRHGGIILDNARPAIGWTPNEQPKLVEKPDYQGELDKAVRDRLLNEPQPVLVLEEVIARHCVHGALLDPKQKPCALCVEAKTWPWHDGVL